jgi:hypothetical protein
VRCGLSCSSLLVALAGATLLATAAPARPPADVPQLPALQRFLLLEHAVVHQAITVRHLEARNEHFDTEAWMDVRTEADATGFRYTVLGEGGSGLIRNKALRSTLDHEKELWNGGDSDRAWFTVDNYTFADGGLDEGGLASVRVTPRRKDLLLVNGSIFLRPESGDLVRVEGALGKSPSFWTRRIDVVRHYERIGGVHVPVAVESKAQIRIAGSSTFKMTYKYLALNGQAVQSQ